MRVLYVPQRNDSRLLYRFLDDTVTVWMDGGPMEGEVFDFSELPDGKAESIESEFLSVNPVLSAERIDGVLHVKLLRYHGPNASESERFPDWVEV